MSFFMQHLRQVEDLDRALTTSKIDEQVIERSKMEQFH